jgi:redox-sensitive bicupin YhaK (pirin superfamily)
VHSERETHEVRARAHSLHGLQLWVALPPEQHSVAPAFIHINKNSLPCVYLPGMMVRVVVGSAYGAASPVETFSPTLFVDVVAEAGAALQRPDTEYELAISIISGGVEIDGDAYYQGDFVLLDSTDSEVRAIGSTRYVMIGGEKLQKSPYINWNFVAYERESIEAARQRWENGAFPAIPGDDQEYIPLP